MVPCRIDPTSTRGALAVVLSGLLTGCSLFGDGEIDWQPFGAEAFEQARDEDKLVLLKLDAIWDPRSQEMEEGPYRAFAVTELVAQSFVPVRVDQSTRPDLASRYRKWGWPATVVLDPNGRDLVRRSGVLTSSVLIDLLEQLARDRESRVEPTPGPAEPGRITLDAAQRQQLELTYRDRFDADRAGWGFRRKRLSPGPLEMALRLGVRGSREDRERAVMTFRRALELLDPVWGGLVRESSGGDWYRPSCEKLAGVQADAIRLYAWAFALTGEEWMRSAVEDVVRYTEAFLRDPEGGYYASQSRPESGPKTFFEMDDPQRRARGIPTVSPERFAGDTGRMTRSLALAAGWLGDQSLRAIAVETGEWVWYARRRPDGLFSHGENLEELCYLSDSLACLEAFVALYELSAQSVWKQRAVSTARALSGRFDHRVGNGELAGYTSSSGSDSPLLPTPDRSENVRLARALQHLFRITEDPRDREAALQAMRFVAAPEVAQRGSAAAVWLVGDEVAGEPLRILVVGPREDGFAQELHAAALRVPVLDRVIEWWDPARGSPPWESFSREGPEVAGGAPVAYVWRAGSPQRVEEAAEVGDQALACLLGRGGGL